MLFTTTPLLPRHGDLQVGFRVRDQLAGQIQRDTLEGAREAELIGVLFRRHTVAAVVAAGQALRSPHVQDRVRHVDAGHSASC